MDDAEVEVMDAPARALDDHRDRDELRRRYYGLLQELRVLLPGAQVLVAFLLTAPFVSRFDQLDEIGRASYGVSLVAGSLAVVAFAAPTVFHRLSDRTARRARLLWGIRMARIGIALLAVALLAGLFAVCRLAFGNLGAAVASGLVSSGIGLAWSPSPWRSSASITNNKTVRELSPGGRGT